MKKLGLVSLLLLFILLSCRQESKEIIFKGRLSNNIEKQIYLYKVTPDGNFLIDSSEIKNGNFIFEVSGSNKAEKMALKEPAFYRLMLNPDNAFTTIARSGEKIEIKADADNLVKTYTVPGSKDAVLLWQLDQQLKNFIDTTDLLYSIYNANIEDDSVRMQIENEYNKLILNHSNYLKKFIADNPSSLATLIAFYQIYNKRKFLDETENFDLLKNIYNQLLVYYPTNENVIFLKKRIELITSKINDENITKK